MLDAALTYLARSWSVVPGHTLIPHPQQAGALLCSCRQEDCESPGKHPRVRWSEFQQRLPTEKEVRYWWERWPDSNVIIVTGRLSGLAVVDVDPRHGGDEAWREWLGLHPLPQTPVALTGGGGQHYFFAHPGQEVRNTTNMLPGVDFRGDGGYVVAPPSKHASGREYAWSNDDHPDDVPLTPMSPLLVLLVLRRLREPGAEGLRKPSVDLEGALEGRVQFAEGERNVEMTRLAGSVASRVPDYASFAGALGFVNAAQASPLADREVEKIARSIWGRETAQRAGRAAEAAREAEGAADMDAQVEALTGGADKLAIATSIWHGLGVKAVTDWYQLQGDRIEYVLVTPEDEVRFPSVLDYDTIRRLLVDHLGVLAPVEKRASSRSDKRAQALRLSAREVAVEPRLAEDRIADWIAAYREKAGVREVGPDERMDAIRSGPIEVDGATHIKVSAFCLFVETQFGESVRVQEMRRFLRRAGWAPHAPLRSYRLEDEARNGGEAPEPVRLWG